MSDRDDYRIGRAVSFHDQAARALRMMGGDAADARKAARAARVQEMWRSLMLHNHYDFILEHTNNVYIVNADGLPRTDGKHYHDDGKDASSTGKGKQLIVYVDDSVVAAELNASRELIKLQFLDHFGEKLDGFKIIISRGGYKKHHPFAPQAVPSYAEPAAPAPLNDKEQRFVEQQAAKVDNPKLARAFRRAMTADLSWKKGLGCTGQQ